MRLQYVVDTDDELGFLYKWFPKRDKILIDNIIFYLHYHLTIVLFFMGCLIVTVAMYILDPIDCITDSAVDEIIDNYCLYHSTYTSSSSLLLQDGLGKDSPIVAHPGVGSGMHSSNQSDRKYHQYYLWVVIFLALQALTFYIPRGLWKWMEGSRVQMVLKEKEETFNFYDEDDDENEKNEREGRRNDSNSEKKEKQQRKRLAAYILSKRHRRYYWNLLFCELLNLINATVQLSIMDMFLGFSLSKLNLDFLQLLQETPPFEKTHMVEQTFPKVTACTFYSYGPSGSIVNYEALCVLPVNSINEKIFGVLYIWLLLLISFSALAVAYRIILLMPFVRMYKLQSNLKYWDTKNIDLKTLGSKMSIGNWQLFLQLCGNAKIDPWELTKIAACLCDHFSPSQC